MILTVECTHIEGGRMALDSVANMELSGSVRKLFQKYGTLQDFKKNSFVFMKGELPVAGYLIEEGLLKVCQLTEKGQNITFFIRKTGAQINRKGFYTE